MSTIKTANIANLSGTSTSVENVLNGTAKAWVNFNGTGTVAIRASYNVSSITDNGTGDYTVNFTTAMVDANYSPTGACCRTLEGGSIKVTSVSNITTGSYRFSTMNGNGGTAVDSDFVFITVNR